MYIEFKIINQSWLPMIGFNLYVHSLQCCL